MALTKVLITVKTYPTISTKYDELVCTAGFREDGSWVRIYPIQFRQLQYNDQYKKYEWIEIDIEKNTSDFRPESYRPHSLDTEPNILGKIDTKNFWAERKKVCLNKIYTNLTILIAEAKDNCTSLATFKPTKIIDFIYEEVEREWDAKKITAMKQTNLFQSVENENFEVVQKLPFKFSYIFEDDEGKKSTLMIEDWELGALYWNCLKDAKDEKVACQKVKEKYFDNFTIKNDLYFFLGTTREHHFVSKNPFIIIGLFYPLKEDKIQGKLF
ncbi:MAG: hypothetical protein EAZ85_02295 [Bacteroidetes bacterium]|nr:MAG: hypothetical protein EAZ85_02295 [Bacteroidota bacterium]TAG90653.1 MAG: hypothetical protein EAZ20_03950 [Bacteroidota bacterium]